MSTEVAVGTGAGSDAARTGGRYLLSGKLRVESPLHVGAGAGRDGIDSTVMLDGEGHPLIPGTSLAGVLREVLTRAGREEVTLLGGIGLTEGASRLVVHDARVVPTDGKRRAIREVRSATSIDPTWGVASAGLLFSREVVISGTEFALTVEVETGGAVDDKAAIEVLSLIEKALVAGLPLGGAVTRGLGVVRLMNSTRTKALNLGTRKGMLAHLAGTSLPWEPVPITPEVGFDSHVVHASIKWHPTSTIMAGVARRGEIDVAPQTTEVRPGGKGGKDSIRLVLPGSGIKGALRARARLIAAAIGTAQAMGAVSWLFGEPRSEQNAQQVGRGALRVRDSTAVAEVPAEPWRDLRDLVKPSTALAPADYNDALKKYNDALKKHLEELAGSDLRFELVHRVAVDRWLGGAAHGLLFTALEPTASTWEPIECHLDLFRVPEPARESAVALLLLVLRDLGRGWIPLGRGTRRGWGDVVVDRVDVRVGNALVSLQDLQTDDLLGARADEGARVREKAQALVSALAEQPGSAEGARP